MDVSEYTDPNERARKRYIRIKYIHFGLKAAFLGFKIVLLIGVILLVKELRPYISGEMVMENPLTTSQISAILVCAAILISIIPILRVR